MIADGPSVQEDGPVLSASLCQTLHEPRYRDATDVGTNHMGITAAVTFP
jgi:hypothetical protein